MEEKELLDAATGICINPELWAIAIASLKQRRQQGQLDDQQQEHYHYYYYYRNRQ